MTAHCLEFAVSPGRIPILSNPVNEDSNIMNFVSKMIVLYSLVMMISISTPQYLKGQDKSIGDGLFIFQGAYDSLGTVDEIAQLAARHNYVVFTHGSYLDGSRWINGKCLDVNYSKMPELLFKVRVYNPAIRIFVYVSATADHPNGCWPQPSVQMSKCPDGYCADFRTWTDLWLNMEHEYEGVNIDGIFVDLVHPALIGTAVRDSVFSYVKSRGKLIMANALSDTIGLTFAAASPSLQPEDFVLIEGYYVLAGNPNAQTEAMNLQLQKLSNRWAALVTETYKSDLKCNSDNVTKAYDMFIRNGGSAFAYQSADLGTQTGTWVYCPNEGIPTTVNSTGVHTISQDAILEQIYPNPFNPTTTIRYHVTKASIVKISVCNVLGQIVRTLVNEYQVTGPKAIEFSAGNLPSGSYFCTMEAGETRQSRIMTLMR
jgi:hypothetical protein